MNAYADRALGRIEKAPAKALSGLAVGALAVVAACLLLGGRYSKDIVPIGASDVSISWAILSEIRLITLLALCLGVNLAVQGRSQALKMLLCTVAGSTLLGLLAAIGADAAGNTLSSMPNIVSTLVFYGGLCAVVFRGTRNAFRRIGAVLLLLVVLTLAAQRAPSIELLFAAFAGAAWLWLSAVASSRFRLNARHS